MVEGTSVKYNAFDNAYYLGNDENKYVAIVIDTDQPNWYAGSLKAVIEHIRNKFYNICFYENNYSKTETISEIDDNGVLKIGEHSFIKVFPNNQ